MEKLLAKLFDYQKFEQESELDALIRETEGRYALQGSQQLSLDELELVAAAGESLLPPDDWDDDEDL